MSKRGPQEYLADMREAIVRIQATPRRSRTVSFSPIPRRKTPSFATSRSSVMRRKGSQPRSQAHIRRSSGRVSRACATSVPIMSSVFSESRWAAKNWLGPYTSMLCSSALRQEPSVSPRSRRMRSRSGAAQFLQLQRDRDDVPTRGRVANDTAFAGPCGFGLPARAVLRFLRSLDSAAVRVRSRTPETRHV